MPRRSEGRKKVEMAKIENKKNLEVTFSKRRDGLFRKANELTIMCGVQVAVVVFAPNKNKVYSYGHPHVDQIVHGFLARNPPELIEALPNARVTGLINELNQKEQALEWERKRGEALQAVRSVNESGEQNWWEVPIDKLNYVQLQQVTEAMKGVREKVDKEAARQKMVNENVAFPYSNFGSALAPGGNFDSSGASGSGSTSYFDSNRASGSGSTS